MFAMILATPLLLTVFRKFVMVRTYNNLAWKYGSARFCRSTISQEQFVSHNAKGRVSNGCYKKKNHAKFSEKRTFLITPDTHRHVHVTAGKQCSFFGKFGVLCFLVTPVLSLAILPYYRRIHNHHYYYYHYYYYHHHHPCQGSIDLHNIFLKYCKVAHKTLHVASSQLTFTCSKSTIETLEKGVKYVQS